MEAVTNNYFKKSSKIPKSIKIFFLVLHFVFGQDFGFGNLFKKNATKLLKYYSTVLALTMFIILIWPVTLIGRQVWYWSTILECVVNFCILKTAKYNVYNLLSDIHAAECIADLEKETFGVITALYALVLFTAKGIAVVARCLFDVDSKIYCERMNHIFHVFFSVSCHAVDLMPESQTVIRFYIYAYVKNMERSLKQDQNINKFIERYNKIADCQDKIRRLCDYFTLMALFINVPKLMASSWFALSFIKKERNWSTTLGEWLFGLHPVIQIVVPAVIAQLTNHVIDDIWQAMIKWEMAERDSVKKAEIIRVMKYMKVRRLQYRIWSVIPTDLNLPLALINICITYLIVIIQFTHLYD